MLPIVFLFSLTICVTGNTQGIPQKLLYKGKSVLIETSPTLNFANCDAVITNFWGYKGSYQDLDTVLFDYVKNGGNLLLFVKDMQSLMYLSENVPVLVYGSIKSPNSLSIKGSGIFSGLNLKITPPLLYFASDTGKNINYLAISDSGYMFGQIVLYSTALGRGSLIVTSVSPVELGKEVVYRALGYFFPDIVIITTQSTSMYKKMIERAAGEDSVFIRLCSDDFEGDINARLVYAEEDVNVIAGDSTKIIYGGEFVCRKFVNCDTTKAYSVFMGRGGFYQLKKTLYWKLSNGNSNEMVFTNLVGDTIGFISFDDYTGVFPFPLSSVGDDYQLPFLEVLLMAQEDDVARSTKIVYFRGPKSGSLNSVILMEIFTIDGRLIKYVKGNGVVKYDFDALPDGMYIIKLKLNNGKDSLLLFNKLQGESQ